jgi:hypothetical protein
VIVLQIDIDDVAAVPAEGDAPIAAGVHCIQAGEFAAQCMKSEARKVEVFRTARRIQRQQDAAKAIRILNAEPIRS